MVQFSTRMDLLKGSEIRELLKLTAQPDIISFAGGMPAADALPLLCSILTAAKSSLFRFRPSRIDSEGAVRSSRHTKSRPLRISGRRQKHSSKNKRHIGESQRILSPS